MTNPDMRRAEFGSSYGARVFGFSEVFRDLSNEFKGIVPPGEIVPIGAESWRHRIEKIDSAGLGSVGSIRSYRYLALTHEGLRVVQEERLASSRGEESLWDQKIVGEPTFVTALRVAGRLSPDELRGRVESIVNRLRDQKQQGA